MEEDLTYSVVVQSTRLKGGLGGVGGGSGQDNPRLHDLWQVYFWDLLTGLHNGVASCAKAKRDQSLPRPMVPLQDKGQTFPL